MEDKPIVSFSGKYRFLSNFWPVHIFYQGLHFKSVEAAYQAAKTNDPKLRDAFTRMDAGEAKRMGRRMTIDPNWDLIKLETMTFLVRQKFNTDVLLKQLLLNTGDKEIIEGNTWGDCYWGVCKGVGQNNLGKILMSIREELGNDSPKC